MSGVALVGYSGSLIKDAIAVVTPLLARALGSDPLIEEPELSRVLVGEFPCRCLMSKSNSQTSWSLKAFSSSYLLKYCKSSSNKCYPSSSHDVPY